MQQWETCGIESRIFERKGWIRPEARMFVAVVRRPNGSKYVIAESAPYCVMNDGLTDRRESEELAYVVDIVLAQGWEPLSPHPSFKYRRRIS
jgi:hypothetical protein